LAACLKFARELVGPKWAQLLQEGIFAIDGEEGLKKAKAANVGVPDAPKPKEQTVNERLAERFGISVSILEDMDARRPSRRGPIHRPWLEPVR